MLADPFAKNTSAAYAGVHDGDPDVLVPKKERAGCSAIIRGLDSGFAVRAVGGGDIVLLKYRNHQ